MKCRSRIDWQPILNFVQYLHQDSDAAWTLAADDPQSGAPDIAPEHRRRRHNGRCRRHSYEKPGGAPPGAWRGDIILVAAALCMPFTRSGSHPFVSRSGALPFDGDGPAAPGMRVYLATVPEEFSGADTLPDPPPAELPCEGSPANDALTGSRRVFATRLSLTQVRPSGRFIHRATKGEQQ